MKMNLSKLSVVIFKKKGYGCSQKGQVLEAIYMNMNLSKLSLVIFKKTKRKSYRVGMNLTLLAKNL